MCIYIYSIMHSKSLGSATQILHSWWHARTHLATLAITCKVQWEWSCSFLHACSFYLDYFSSIAQTCADNIYKMPGCCCATNCRSNYPGEPTVHVHRFPSDAAQKAWTRAVLREDFAPSNYTVVNK